MRNANAYSECRLPVSLELVAAKIKSPVGNTVKLAQNAGTAVLMGCAGRLLDRIKLNTVT